MARWGSGWDVLAAAGEYSALYGGRVAIMRKVETPPFRRWAVNYLCVD